MLVYVMLFWVGLTLNPPSIYWWCWGIGFGIVFLKGLLDIYKAGAKQADDE